MRTNVALDAAARDEAFVASILARTDKSTGCWLWLGPTDDKGYGLTNYWRRAIRTHRLSWRALRGEIGALQVLHECPGGDNPRCMNPDHLKLGTHAENMADKIRKGQCRSGDQRGSMNPSSKLTESDVAVIRRTLQHLPPVEVAAMFGLGVSHVCAIRSRRLWSHVP